RRLRRGGFGGVPVSAGTAQIRRGLPGRLMSRTPLPSPAELFGELLHEVQVRRLFPDGKYFVDMEPRLPPAQIMSRFHRLCLRDDRTLATFVAEHFDPPAHTPAGC